MIRASLAALLVLAIVPAAHAEDKVVLDFTESFFADWHWTLDDPPLTDGKAEDVIDFRNRLNVRLRYGHWNFGVRLDAALFPSPPVPTSGASQYQNDLRPEEMFVSYEDGPWKLTLGDDYLTVGRGMALSLRKFDEIGFATSLRGAHLEYRGSPVRLRLGVGLTNTVNVDLVEEKLVPDPNDAVAFVRAEWSATKQLRVGAHLVDIERRASDIRNGLIGWADDGSAFVQNSKELRSTIGGVSVAANGLGGFLDLYGEADYLVNDDERETLTGSEPSGKNGSALYLSASANAGATNVLLEGKRYENYVIASSKHPDTVDETAITQTFPYIQPPTLERIDQRVVNNHDVTGVHLRVDHGFAKTDQGDRHSLFASAAFFVDAPAEDEWTFHGYVGWERIGAGGRRMQVQLGLRQEEAPDEDIIRLRMVHFDLDWFEVITAGVDVQLHWTHEFRDEGIGAPTLRDGYQEGTFYVSVNLPPHWSVTGQVEYLTSEDNAHPTFPGAFLQYKLDTDSFVRIFVGRSKGGLKCSGGICRIFPDFDGVKLEATLRF